MIGGYAGLSNGKDGATHHSIEDIAIMRAIPNNVVLACSDPLMTRKITRRAAEYDGPVYIRMEYEAVPYIHDENTEFEIGKGVVVRKGRDVSILTAGTALWRAVQAAERLAETGIDAEVIDMLSIKPLDAALVLETAAKTGAVVTVEDHNRIGGLASAVAEVLLEAGAGVRFKALAIDDLFTESGNTNELRARYGIDESSIAKAAEALVRKGRSK
jgi:transketolase